MLKKYSFPKNRIFQFNDAVFSIAITLLVLDITIPTFAQFKERGFGLSLQYLIPDFIGFFVSFMVIALYWKFYLLITRYVSDFDDKLFRLNIFLLLAVVLLPFSTGFFVDFFDDRGPFTFYCANLVLIGLFLYIMTRIILKRAKLKIDPIDAQWLRFRGALAVVFWIVLMVLSFYFDIIVKMLIPVIFVVQYLGKLYFNRKFKKRSNSK